MICDIEKKYGPCEVRKPSKRADNQYTLVKTKEHLFFALFKDGEGKEQESQITEAVYLELLKQTREDDARLRWERRHVDYSVDAATLAKKPINVHSRIVEDTGIAAMLVDESSPVRRVVTALQWRRLQLHYCLGLTFEEIAEMDGCTRMAINDSLTKAMKKIQKFL